MALPIDSNITADTQARAATLKPVQNNVLEIGVKAHPANPGLGSQHTINSGLATASQLPDIGAEIKQTDHNALTGSNKGDHRHGQVKVDMTPFSNPPAPRDRVRQFADNSREPAAKAPQVTDPGDEVVGD